MTCTFMKTYAMHASDVAVITGKTFAGQKLDFSEMLVI